MAKINVTLSDGRVVVATDKAQADLILELDRKAQTAAASQRTAGGTVSIRFNAIGSTLPSGGTGKGNIGIYGLGRYPVTLYAAQVAKLAGELPNLAGMILRHAGELSWRDDDSKAATLAWAESVVKAGQQATPAAE